mgnify:CR=1 FL=1
MWRGVGRGGRCGEVWGDVGRCGEVWGGVGRCGEVWGDVGRCGEMRGEVHLEDLAAGHGDTRGEGRRVWKKALAVPQRSQRSGAGRALF